MKYIKSMPDEPKAVDTTTPFLARIDRYSAKHGLMHSGDTVVVAVSGGMDSIVLLDVLSHQAGLNGLKIHIAHLDHDLRGDESKADAVFVQTLAKSHGLPFHTQTIDCTAIAKTHKISIEQAARDERRTFLTNIAKTVGAQRIATGHHLDDQAETILLRLMRGTGTAGLAGIRPLKDGVWIRPLLGQRRDQIEAYARSRHLQWRTDRTNLDARIPRNRVRHQLIPILKSDYGGHVPAAIARATEILREDDNLLDEITLDASKTVICAHSDRKIALDGPRYFGYHVAVQRRLTRTFLTQLGLDPKRITLDLIDRILADLQLGRSGIQISDNLTASSSGRLIILGTSVPEFEHKIELGFNRIEPIKSSVNVEHVEASAFPSEFADVSRFETWFDRSAVPEGLVLRTIRTGDRICPFGGGTVKVSDLLINRKVPRGLRDEIPVLANQAEVFWVVGIRASEKSRISKKCKQATRFQFDGNWKHLYKAFEEPS
jgi:tRNA(Ile)-lysidine synthase